MTSPRRTKRLVADGDFPSRGLLRHGQSHCQLKRDLAAAAGFVIRAILTRRIASLERGKQLWP
jgi:hypothetical protein